MSETASPGPPQRLVVVVDDAPAVRETIAAYLEAEGFTVARAADGVEAMLQVRRLRPSNVVLDLLMPRQDGLETLREIKALDSSIRVVVVTGATDAALQTQAQALGANAFLRKPITSEALVAAVSGIVPADSGASAPKKGRRVPPV